MANKLKIRKGDRVKVIAGRSKGKIGDVLRVIAADERVVVSGVNVIKRHTKPNRTEQGGSSNARPRSTCRTWPCSIKTDKPTKSLILEMFEGALRAGSGETIDR